MTVCTLSNLDFEYELAAGQRYQSVPIMRKVSQKWQSILRLLPGAEDAECYALDAMAPSFSFECEEVERLFVWGVTPGAVRLAQKMGCTQAFPDPEVVREVNDKRFSHRLEKEFGVALPYSCIVEDLGALKDAIAKCPTDWILKHPFGVSGRERVLGKSQTLTKQAEGWAARQLKRGWTLLFEPWVQEKKDASLHLTITSSGDILQLGYCELITDGSGTHRGNGVFPSHHPPEQVLSVGLQAAEVLKKLGYWGDVGFDVFSGVLEGQPVLRPIVEINARCSFGRLTLALQSWIPEDWGLFWWHPTQKICTQMTAEHGPLRPFLPGTNVPGLYVLPPSIDPEQRSGTFVLVSEDVAELNEAYLLRMVSEGGV
ncbi:MAG: hypothetical protein CL920_14540 [Deltaproteobacteria bacterium]|nr:hypothetical protein [Deltaproteobacteria bacterium]MBU49902.1 hypothetical protein [Deltaproteobacteria bacterium]|tara:strand:+ start:6875 stop:7987 length:1113 start_codon:yes stop_codon:yes gene_type:complete